MILVSCGDDDDDGIIQVPEADRNEQQVIDNDSLLGYFQTHYINQSQLIGNLNIGLDEIIINELPADGQLPNPSQNILLSDIVEVYTTRFSGTEYEYYIIKLNQG